MKKKKIGLALSGGATKGMATLAIVKQLQKENIAFDIISGTSAGAIVGAYLAFYGEVKTLADEILGFSTIDWFNLADFSLTNTVSLLKAKKYQDFLNKKFGDKEFSDSPVPLIITATNLNTGTVKYFQEGKIVNALLASTAYPGLFPPHVINGQSYNDGGILDNLPHEILIEEGAHKIIAVNLNRSNDTPEKKLNNVFSVVSRSMELMINNALDNINIQNKNLFVLSPDFGKNHNSLWNMNDLKEKYDIGTKTFADNKTAFVKWYQNQ